MKKKQTGVILMLAALFDEYTAGRGVHVPFTSARTVGDNGAYNGLERRHYVEYLCFPRGIQRVGHNKEKR